MPRRNRMLWIWLLAGFGSTGIVFLAIFGVAVAVLGASFTGCQPSSEPALASTGPTPSAYALASIPPTRLRLYQQAGTRFDIDWSFLASIGAQECGNGECAGTNPAGCAGPMQIAYVPGSACSPGPGPTLWERYAVNADPGQPLSINNPADAIYTAARILREDMGAPPTGGSYSEYRQAACHYYGACADASVSYAEEVMARAVQYGFTGAGSPTPSNPPLAQPVSGSCNASPPAPALASNAQIVRVAESQIGQGEHPAGSECTIYGPCEEWCSLFASWVWKESGVPLPGTTAVYGYSGSLYTWAREHDGRILPPSATPSPGDAVFYGQDPEKSVTSGSCSASTRTGGSRRSRATMRATSRSSARSTPPTRLASVSAPPSTGTPSRLRLMGLMPDAPYANTPSGCAASGTAAHHPACGERLRRSAPPTPEACAWLHLCCFRGEWRGHLRGSDCRAAGRATAPGRLHRRGHALLHGRHPERLLDALRRRLAVGQGTRLPASHHVQPPRGGWSITTCRWLCRWLCPRPPGD